MAITTDFVSDISAYVLWGKTLVKNLYTKYNNYIYLYSLPIPLNNISKRKITRDSNSEVVYFIYEVYYNYKYSNFKLFYIKTTNIYY